MEKLRSLHLYLGCLFAPMLLFFPLTRRPAPAPEVK
jgi:hypothetical protein